MCKKYILYYIIIEIRERLNLKVADDRSKERVRQVLELLKGEYGIPDWQLRNDPVAVLVQTILSQNTSDTNSQSAFRSLLTTFEKWEDVASASVEIIAHCIRRGGLGRVKARYIKRALEEIMVKRASVNLDFLAQLTLTDAEGWLLQLPGVGLKTARCVLLFSLGLPALPVDTHIWRVTQRLGLTSPKASLQEAHRILAGLVPPEEVYSFHILVIEHGRKICRARHPRCRECVLDRICISQVH